MFLTLVVKSGIWIIKNASNVHLDGFSIRMEFVFLSINFVLIMTLSDSVLAAIKDMSFEREIAIRSLFQINLLI